MTPLIDRDPAPAAIGRPRDPEVSRAILDAALEALARDGYARLNIADVARRAGVHKPAVYRRWGCKLDLAVAAIQHIAPPARDPDTGSIRADLVRMLLDADAPTARSSRLDVALRVRAELTMEPELAAAVDAQIVAPRRALARTVVDRGVARGELRSDADAELITDLLFGPLHMRALGRRPPLRKRDAERIVDLLLGGIASLRTDAPRRR